MFDKQETTIQSVLTVWNEAQTKLNALREKMELTRQAFLSDCDRVDAALNGEQENLRSEIDELTQTIKRLSGQLAAGVTSSGRIDKDVKENLRKLIREATARRDEAQATLDGLADVVPEYNKELYDAAVEAKDAFLTEYRGGYADTSVSLYQCLTDMERAVSEAKETVSARGSVAFVDRQFSEVAGRFNHSDRMKQPAPVDRAGDVRTLGQPLSRPAYLD